MDGTPVPEEDEEAMLERYRRMDRSEKLLLVFRMMQEGIDRERARIRDRFRDRHGRDISERELSLRMISRHLDRETMIRNLGWDPAAED